MGWGDEERPSSSNFVWAKKLEKEGLKNLSKKEIENLNKRKKMDNIEELEKLKKRRLEREAQRVEREKEMYESQRAKEAAQFDEWQKQEETFHLEQARLRSKIRIQDGRAKPIDLLAQYINDQNLEESIEMQMHEPSLYIQGLSIDDLEDLTEDIKVYNELEKNENSDYWNDIMIIVEDDLKKLKKSESDNQGRREGIHQSVSQDVSKIFKGKTTTQLNELRRKIEDKLSSKAEGIDIAYWESLLSNLKAHMARARLRDRHQDNLKSKLELLKREQEEILIKEEDLQEEEEEEAAVMSEHSNSPKPSTSRDLEPSTSKVLSDDDDESSQDVSKLTLIEQTAESDLLQECFKLYEKGNYSPRYLKLADFEPHIEILTEDQNQQRLEEMRMKVIEEEENQEKFDMKDVAMRKEARKGMNDDEAEFSVESKLDPQVYLWSDKYRPRKPRYFNRVHTGFEWNKYNQTHYDLDNPPPKIVQGYKFNIFFPDLIDKRSTPQYYLTPCADNHDFAILKFHSGPPYEDIAFKIVNREWEYSYKRGFRCQFQNNIFQLWFHFKRYRYRR